MTEKTTIQINKEVRLKLKKVALEMGDLTMIQTINELIGLYENRKTD